MGPKREQTFPYCTCPWIPSMSHHAWSPVGLHTKLISMKESIIADNISCIQHKSEFPTAFLCLCQAHTALAGCQRFLLSSELTSCIMEIILQHACVDPIRKHLIALAQVQVMAAHLSFVSICTHSPHMEHTIGSSNKLLFSRGAG